MIDTLDKDRDVLDRELKLHALTLDYARKLATEIDESQFADQPALGVNPPAWIIGHLAVVADLGVRFLGGQNTFSDEWRKQFGPGSTPTGNLADYPSKQDLLDAFEEASARLREAARNVDPARLEARQPTKFFKDELPTIGDFSAHILTTHSMLHLGQLSMWRRFKGYGSALGI